jgi:hypothetical protein
MVVAALEGYSRAQSFSDAQTKRPPEGGLSAALIEAENLATRNTPARRSYYLAPRINLSGASSYCEVKRLVPSAKPNKRCPYNTKRFRPLGELWAQLLVLNVRRA